MKYNTLQPRRGLTCITSGWQTKHLFLSDGPTVGRTDVLEAVSNGLPVEHFTGEPHDVPQSIRPPLGHVGQVDGRCDASSGPLDLSVEADLVLPTVAAWLSVADGQMGDLVAGKDALTGDGDKVVGRTPGGAHAVAGGDRVVRGPKCGLIETGLVDESAWNDDIEREESREGAYRVGVDYGGAGGMRGRQRRVRVGTEVDEFQEELAARERGGRGGCVGGSG